jgi:hypothetical protein
MAVEWTTQSDEGPVGAYGNGYDTQPLPTQPPPQPLHAPLPEESVTPPVTSAPPPVPTHAAPVPSAAPQALSGFEQCPSCGALVAVDQRYCLECGHRRGEPRLPFMDAVVFMDAMNRPPEAAAASTKTKKRGISPNTALIAGVGTLLLALGIGVLIGRSGHGSAPAAAAPQVVTVSGAGAEEAKASSSGGETIGGGAGTHGKSKKQVVKTKKKAAETGEGAEKVLHPAPGVNLPKATTQIGEKCEKEVAGCSKNGKFEGTFFGEE